MQPLLAHKKAPLRSLAAGLFSKSDFSFSAFSFYLQYMRWHVLNKVAGFCPKQLAELILHDNNNGRISTAKACLERSLRTYNIRGR